MKPEEIKEALERYIALYGRDICIADNIKVADILDLINQYEAEKKQLNIELSYICYLYDKLKEKELPLIIQTAKAEAHKEFAKMLKEESEYFWEEKENFVSEEQIDNLLKEMGVE